MSKTKVRITATSPVNNCVTLGEFDTKLGEGAYDATSPNGEALRAQVTR